MAVEDVEELNKNEIIQKNTNTHPFFSLTRRRIRWIHNIDARFNLSYPELTSVSLALSVLLFLRGSSEWATSRDEWSLIAAPQRAPGLGFALHDGCLPCMHAKEESWNVLPLRQAQRCAGGMNSRLSSPSSSPSSSASAGSKSLACSTVKVFHARWRAVNCFVPCLGPSYGVGLHHSWAVLGLPRRGDHGTGRERADEYLLRTGSTRIAMTLRRGAFLFLLLCSNSAIQQHPPNRGEAKCCNLRFWGSPFRTVQKEGTRI